MYLEGEYVKVKSQEEIEESVNNILEYNERCDYGEEEFSDFDDNQHTCGLIGRVCEYDPDDNSYLVRMENDDDYWYHENWIEKVEPYTNKFKVGDEVEILPKPDNYPFAWSDHMNKYVGTKGWIQLEIKVGQLVKLKVLSESERNDFTCGFDDDMYAAEGTNGVIVSIDDRDDTYEIKTITGHWWYDGFAFEVVDESGRYQYEIGQEVVPKELDNRDENLLDKNLVYVDNMLKYQGKIGKIVNIDKLQGHYCVKFENGISYNYYAEWLELPHVYVPF